MRSQPPAAVVSDRAALTPTPSPPATRAKPLWTSLFRSTPVIKVLAGALILLLWEVIVRSLAPAYVAKPTGIVAVFPQVMSSPAFLHAGAATLGAVAKGLCIALIVGTLVGLVMGRVRVVDHLLKYYVYGLYAVPMVAVIPIVTLWFGYTGDARLAVVVFAAFFSIAINVGEGARALPLEYLEVARSYRAGARHILFAITLPASIPYLLAGVRLAAGRALIGAVVAEFFTAIEGLGYYILYNSRIFRHDQAFVAVALLAAFGVTVEVLINGFTRRYLAWYRREEKTK